jgi:hypothetical protein
VIAARADSLQSSPKLVGYIREHHVEQLYSCWCGDESELQESERRIAPDALLAPDFFFRAFRRIRAAFLHWILLHYVDRVKGHAASKIGKDRQAS